MCCSETEREGENVKVAVHLFIYLKYNISAPYSC